jgi:hypothetical protein
MTWTTVMLILVAWCLVSVVAGFAFAFFFGGLTRIHPDELEKGRAEALSRKRPRTEGHRVKGRGKARAGATYSPLSVGGAPHPPLEDH